MKKFFSAGLLVSAAAVLILGSCGKQNPLPEESSSSSEPVSKPTIVLPDKPKSSETTKEDPSKAEQNSYNDTLLKELYSEEGEVTLGDSSVFKYSYHVPAINADTPGAVYVNESIKAEFMPAMLENMECVKAKQSPYHHSIEWKSFWNGSTVSLLTEAKTVDGIIRYGTISYDFETDQVVDNAGLLKKAGVDEKKFAPAMVRAYAESVDEYMKGLPIDMFDSQMTTRSQILSLGNSEYQALYLDENGEIRAAVQIYTISGAGVQGRLLRPDFSEPESPEKTVECEFVKAELKNGQVLLSFTKTEDAERLLPESFDYGREYAVEGLYRNYTDIAAGVLGQDIYPYVVLITDNGDMEYCDIVSGAQYGCFCSSGPVPQAKEIISCEPRVISEGGSGYHTLIAADKSGNEYDLTDYAGSMSTSLPDFLRDGTIWTTESGKYTFYYAQDSEEITLVDSSSDGAPVWYIGSINYLGMTEDGIICSYFLREDGGENVLAGAMQMMKYMDYDSGMDVTCLSGTEMFGTKTGEKINLVPNW